MDMTLKEALDLILYLSSQNIIDEDAKGPAAKERERQTTALTMVEDHIADGNWGKTIEDEIVIYTNLKEKY